MCLGTAQHRDTVGQLVAVERQVFSQLMAQHVTCTGAGLLQLSRGVRGHASRHGAPLAHMLGLSTYPGSLPEAKTGLRASYKVAVPCLAGPRSQGLLSGCTICPLHWFRATARQKQQLEQGEVWVPGACWAQAVASACPACLWVVPLWLPPSSSPLLSYHSSALLLPALCPKTAPTHPEPRLGIAGLGFPKGGRAVCQELSGSGLPHL